MAGRVNIRTLLQLLAAVYFIAFVSWGIQAQGLIGSHGVLPASDFLAGVRRQLGSAAYWNLPTIFWLNASDGALRAAWILGALCSLAAMAAPSAALWRLTPWKSTRWKPVTRVALGGCLVLWLSLGTVGQDFLSFQWDVLLLEAGFLAIFADDSPVRIWLFRWLIFRLMFYSGVVKLLSHDPSWHNLTALHFHYWTQPLPTPLAWYMEQLPMWFHQISTAFTFFVELVAPFLFFAPGPIRRVAAWLVIALQVLILLTGNYTSFNWLAIILTLFLFVEPKREARDRMHLAVDIALVAFIGVVSGSVTLQIFNVDLPGQSAILRAAEPLRIVNSYGLFAVMTTERPEIIVEGSNDGLAWLAYEFPYKPGDIRRAPPIVAPYQPRLDWQMWFAALSNYQSNRWFVGFMLRLLEGEPSVLRLMRYNPFPNSPPKYIRARVYLYQFTKFGEPGWWTREDRGLYFPPIGLK
jgi:lipase maturation factor 1